MTIEPKIATVFGGTGFVGRYVVQALARAGYTIKVATRAEGAAYFLRPYGGVGQIVPVAYNPRERASLEYVIDGASLVVNCVGVLYERRRGDFKRLHTELPATIAAICAEKNIGRLVHFSALGVDGSTSRYARTKLAGEQAVLAAFPSATILRPSVVFGPDDNFFNRFAAMARFVPALPLIGGGHTRFQPVYVGDVAHAAVVVATASLFGQNDTPGGVFELGGPEVLTMREVYIRTMQATGRKRRMVNVPFFVASILAMFTQWLPPRPVLTMDQVKSLRSDSVVADDALGFVDMGLVPTAMGLIVPAYLERFRSGGRFANKQRA